MGNMPESAVDPNGLVPERSSNNYDGFTSFAMGGGALEGYAGGPASEAWFGGGYGGGSGINDINAILSAFGYGGCANIAEWVRQQEFFEEFWSTIEAAPKGTTFTHNDDGSWKSSSSTAPRSDMGAEVNSEGTTLLPDITVTDSRPNWEQWGERVNEMFGQSLGWDFDEYAKTHWYDGMSDWLSDAWNSPYARMMIQDKYSISIGGDFAAILGVGAQPINFSILMRGKEPGIYLTPSFSVNAGGGAFVSGGITFGGGY